MVLNIITEQLANKLPEDSKLLKYNIINPVNFNQLYQLLTFNKISEICVTDSTATDNIEFGTIIPVKDHVNRTGTNILIGKQQFLRIDFIDMTNQYITKQNSIITDCCGKTLNNKYNYPSHYLCHIVCLAHALKINKINGFLYNTI